MRAVSCVLREEAQAGPPGDARGPGWGELEDQLAGLVAGARGATPQSRAVCSSDAQTQCSTQCIKKDHVGCEVGSGLSILESRVSLESEYCCS